MLEFFSTLHWGAAVQIIVIDILLGGDNAVVIALGTLGAILLRVVLIGFAVMLLDIPFLKFVAACCCGSA